MKILLLGASGVTGRSTLPQLIKDGHDVLAHSRSLDHLSDAARLGATPIEGDAFDPTRLRGWLTGCDAVIDLRVSIPGAATAALPWSWRDYARLRDDGCRAVVDAALQAGVPRVVRDTVTMVYTDGGDAWIDETRPTHATGALAANLAAEAHLARLTAAGGAGVAIRFAGYYGPDDAFSRECIRAARSGRALIAGPPTGWTSAIHTDDVGSAVAAGLTAPAGVYNAVDDEPLRRDALLRLLASSAAKPRLTPLPEWAARLASAPVRSLARSHRVSNARLKALGWAPSVASRRTGWPEAFAATPS